MITAVILAHNDEKIIERAIKSVQFCDEVIVIDDESTDETVKRAEKAGAKVYRRALKGDFAEQRNYGLSKATGDWVLFVDSDEIVSTELRKELTNVMQSEDGIPRQARDDSKERGDGFYVRRRDFLFGKWLTHGETANVRLLRLARKDVGRWTRPVHEVWEVNGEIGELMSPLLHYPHPSVNEFLTEVNDYSTRNAKYMFSKGVKTNWLQIIFWPKAKFIQNYLWRGGFMDGVPGFIVAMMMSLHSFLTRGKLYILWRDARQNY